MPQPTSSDVHVDRPLSNIAIGYKNQAYVADSIFPVVPVEKESDLYFVWTKDFWFRNTVELRAPGDTYPEGGLELSTTSYFAKMYHQGFPLNDEEIANQDEAVELAQTGAEWIADQFLLNREIKISGDIFATGKWDTDKTLSGANQWDDYASSDPIGDVDLGKQTIQKSTGRVPNRMLMGQEVMDILKQHPLLLDKFKHTSVGILSAEQVADALNIEKILVGASVQNTANEGATFAGAYIWGKSALLLYVAQGVPSKRTPTAGLTFAWKGVNQAAVGITVPITRVREDSRDRDMLRGKHAFDNKIVGKDLGYFFATAVS